MAFSLAAVLKGQKPNSQVAKPTKAQNVATATPDTTPTVTKNPTKTDGAEPKAPSWLKEPKRVVEANGQRGWTGKSGGMTVTIYDR